MKKARRNSRKKSEERRQAFERGRRLSFTAREASKRLAFPTEDDENKVARRTKRQK